MKRISIMSFVLALVSLCAAGAGSDYPGWKLVWADEFNGDSIDAQTWSTCDRAHPDWCNKMSDDARLYDVRDGAMILRGMVNPDTVADPLPVITGGVWTRDKKRFDPPCRIEVRARLHGAKGAWPAIWLLPYDYKTNPWPNGGEIDIMERLNNNHGAYQTVHSHYTYDLKQTGYPQSSVYSPIDRDDYNVYGVDILPDKVVFRINGKETYSYPKIDTDKPGQFPFFIPQYLLIDMQLGGTWVGEIDKADLPVEMEVDWVRYYVPEQ